MRKAVLLCAALLLIVAANAYAFPPIDLTAGQNGVVSAVDGTIWNSDITQPTGTGVYNPFVRLQANGDEHGFNTDFDPAPLDAKPGLWTHSVQFGSLATVTIGGVDYYSFSLDANEVNSGNKSFISLDTIEIYKVTGERAESSYADMVADGTLLYDMDDANLNGITTAAEDQTVYIETALKQGSGTDDVTVYIPKSFFTSALATDYMYFYSKFGNADATYDGFSTSDGFEEWRALQGPNTPPPPPPIPEPATVMLLGSGLAGVLGARFRKK